MCKKLLVLLLCCTPLFSLEIGKFGLPVPERYTNAISSGQGLREQILTEEKNGVTLGGVFHNGIDWALPYGTDVYAAKDGVARIVYPGKGNNTEAIKWKGHEIYGSCILLEHNDGTFSLYAHLSKTLIITNQEVKSGELIALSGGTGQAAGRSSGNHLHFTVYVKLSEVFDFGE